MDSLTIWHWLVVLAGLVLAWLWPIWMILRRMGYSPAWSFISLVPVLSAVGLWAVALKRWPMEGRRNQ